MFYAIDGSAVRVSSQLGALVRDLGQRPSLDIERLGALGVTRVGPDPRATVYRGVRRLLPCESIQFLPDGSTRTSFRLPQVPACASPDPIAHARELRGVLDRAIARDLARFRRVGVLTGGGLDSGGLFALVADLSRRVGLPKFTALAMDFAGPGDDRPYLRALQAWTSGEVIRVSPSEAEPLSLSMFERDAAPNTWPTCPVGEVLARRAKEWGAEALVSGFGGDFVLDGTLDGFAERARRGDLRAVGEVARLPVPWGSSPLGNIVSFIVKPMVRDLLPPRILAARRSRWRATQAVTSWAGARLLPLLAEPVNDERRDEHWLTAFATSLQMMEGADGVGQTEVASGLPYVTPYLGPSFIELVAGFPPEELFHGGLMRGLFRLALADVLPSSLAARTDKASFEPMFDAMFVAMGGRAAFRSLLTMEATADLGLVEPASFRGIFDRVVARETTARGWLEVWPMLAVEAFVRRLGGAS